MLSWSITQSALPAVCACFASNKNFFIALDVDVIANVAAADVPPPGVGLNTVTLAVPAVATSEALTLAVNSVALTNVVVKLAVFHLITEPFIKLLPFTVKVKAAAPAAHVEGEVVVKVGIGFVMPE